EVLKVSKNIYPVGLSVTALRDECSAQKQSRSHSLLDIGHEKIKDDRQQCRQTCTQPSQAINGCGETKSPVHAAFGNLRPMIRLARAVSSLGQPRQQLH